MKDGALTALARHLALMSPRAIGGANPVAPEMRGGRGRAPDERAPVRRRRRRRRAISRQSRSCREPPCPPTRPGCIGCGFFAAAVLLGLAGLIEM